MFSGNIIKEDKVSDFDIDDNIFARADPPAFRKNLALLFIRMQI